MRYSEHSIEVSIHAPREGCDVHSEKISFRAPSFNSRTPGGVRPRRSGQHGTKSMFQFTHPGRGATWLTFRSVSIVAVSIHAPREGCDYRTTYTRGRTCLFQFTHPGRGATGIFHRLQRTTHVSIHAPREGCDAVLNTHPITL